MDISDPHCHTCTCRVAVPATEAFEYMADGLKQGEWTFGSWNRRQIGEGLFVGTSMFDNQDTYVKIDADRERLLIYYHLGEGPDRLEPRNMARIVPLAGDGDKQQSCLITLLAWRSPFMDDSRWKQLCVSHETQMFIIKARLEAGRDGA